VSVAPRNVVLGKMSLAALFWGGTYITGRIAAPEMSAPVAALWRFIIALAALLALTRLQHQSLKPMRSSPSSFATPATS